jgi:hypothetical protein
MGHFSLGLFLTKRVPRHRRAVKPCEINDPLHGHTMTNSLYAICKVSTIGTLLELSHRCSADVKQYVLSRLAQIAPLVAVYQEDHHAAGVRDFCLATTGGSLVGYEINRVQSMSFNTTAKTITHPAGGCPQRASAARDPAVAPISSGTWG